MALQFIAARAPQERPLLGAFDTFGRNRQPHGVTERQHSGDNRGRLGRVADMLNEALVDLDLVDLKFA